MRQSAATRLARAERDLAKAEATLARMKRWEPGLVTSAEDIAAMREKARDRVLRLRIRVETRRRIAEA